MSSVQKTKDERGYCISKVEEIEYDRTEHAAPHRYFKNSFAFTISSSDVSAVDGNVCHSEIKQIVHKHANGLCIITAGDEICKIGVVDKVEYFIDFDSILTTSKKKKTKRGHPSYVRAHTPLAKVHFKCFEGKYPPALTLVSCVAGNIIELNAERLNVDPELLSIDPLMKGYVAIIQEMSEKKDCLVSPAYQGDSNEISGYLGSRVNDDLAKKRKKYGTGSN